MSPQDKLYTNLSLPYTGYQCEKPGSYYMQREIEKDIDEINRELIGVERYSNKWYSLTDRLERCKSDLIKLT